MTRHDGMENSFSRVLKVYIYTYIGENGKKESVDSRMWKCRISKRVVFLWTENKTADEILAKNCRREVNEDSS